MKGTQQELQKIADRARQLLAASSDPVLEMKRAAYLLSEQQSDLLPVSLDREDPDQFVADLLLNNPVVPDLLRLKDLSADSVVNAENLEELVNRLM